MSNYHSFPKIIVEELNDNLPQSVRKKITPATLNHVAFLAIHGLTAEQLVRRTGAPRSAVVMAIRIANRLWKKHKLTLLEEETPVAFSLDETREMVL